MSVKIYFLIIDLTCVWSHNLSVYIFIYLFLSVSLTTYLYIYLIYRMTSMFSLVSTTEGPPCSPGPYSKPHLPSTQLHTPLTFFFLFTFSLPSFLIFSLHLYIFLIFFHIFSLHFPYILLIFHLYFP